MTLDPLRLGPSGRLARAFLDSKLTPLLIAASLALGALALLATPREEEPQIRVPMVDLLVAWPGAEPEEVASRVLEPLERAMWGLAGVDHVYARADAGSALLTVRFRVGEPSEPSLVKVYDRLAAMGDFLPPAATAPAVELRSIEDVPFLALTLWSETLSSDQLRPLAAELARELSAIERVSKAYLVGGARRVVRVEPDPDRMAAHGVSWGQLTGALSTSAAARGAGTAVAGNRETAVVARAVLADARDVERTVVALRDGRPLYVADVARVLDGPDEARDAVFFSPGPAGRARGLPAGEHAAVTIALAKRPGANATTLAESALARVETVRPHLLPRGVEVAVTRNYGETARQKSNELVQHLLIATLSVVALISLAMGWRSGLVVGIAVPVTLALTLFIYFLAGYTLNRVTLFALIFSIGILVDDAIVVVENIERHHRKKPGQPFVRTALEAVDEVGNPTILATFTVIAAILPMAFVRGLMGPYMRPIPTGATAAMLFSLLVAFIVSPWAARRVFRHHAALPATVAHPPQRESRLTRRYRRLMHALVTRPGPRRAFFAVVLAAFAAALSLVAFGVVRVKMLPFDNKSELQVLVDHPEGTPLEVTLETARQVRRYLDGVPEVADVQLYAGTAAPFNFNGLVRHYFLRQAPQGADLQVNLADKHERERQSHALARELRPAIAAIARRRGAVAKVVEIPPGPPVLDTLVAEVYGPSAPEREELARAVRGAFEVTPGVVDVDDSLAAAPPRLVAVPDREKAGSKGIAVAAVVEALAGPGEGRPLASLDVPAAREPVPVVARLAAQRRGLDERLALRLDTPGGAVALSELVRVHREPAPQPVLRKDLVPVVYVFGDLAGERESPVYALAALDEKVDALRLADGSRVARIPVSAPAAAAASVERPALRWDGEWQITYEVFRDLGIAFAVVLVLIGILVVGWFQSFSVPVAILLPVPLSLIGILPAHALLGAPFTATSMIGFIAGAGIIVRNSIILVDFIELELRRGRPLALAVVEAGAVRFRPMLLTAAAVVAGSFVILFDPIFQGLAISLMAGEVAATLLSRLAVPVVYCRIARRGRAAALAGAAVGAEPAAAA
jgi:multidrug efflux pump subunit AcrB